MSIEFRSRIPSSIEYKELLLNGICCQGITLVPPEDYNYDYKKCYLDHNGYFIPGISGENGVRCPDDHK